jgi:flagellar protein FliL
MAEEENREGEEGTPVVEGKAGSSSKTILLAVGAAFILIVAIGTPILIMSMKGEKQPNHDDLLERALVEEEYQRLQLESQLEDSAPEEGEEVLGAFYPLETFVVNLSDGGYLRAQIQLEFFERDVPRRFYSRLIPIRDGLITLLSSRSRESLISSDGKQQLKEDVQELVNQALRRDLVKNVYFGQFVVQ